MVRPLAPRNWCLNEPRITEAEAKLFGDLVSYKPSSLAVDRPKQTTMAKRKKNIRLAPSPFRDR